MSLKKPLLALASPLVAFALLEGVLRLSGFTHIPPEVPIKIWNPREDTEMKEGRSLHDFDPYSLWSPRAGAPVDWGKDEKINDGGWRGPLLATDRSEGVLRIATLGDSSTFGMGVPYPDSYSGQLEKLLDEGGTPAEVLNGGVIGFTSRQGLERYKHLIRPFAPDVVVAAFGAVNEHYGCKSMPDAPKLAKTQRKVVGAGRLKTKLREELRVAHLVAYLHFQAHGGKQGMRESWDAQEKQERELQHTAGEVEWPGIRRVSPDDFDRALTELRAAVEADGARLILVCMPRDPAAETQRPVLLKYSERVVEVARREGLQLADIRREFRRRFDSGTKPAELFLPGDFWHPNPTGHGVIAAELARLIADETAGRP